MKPLLMALVLPWSSAAWAEGYDPFAPDLNRPRMVRVQVEFVEVKQSSYLALMETEQKTADATGLRRRVVGLVEQGEASVLETMLVMGRSGEKATVESICERIYPSEYEPPGSLPGSFASTPIQGLGGGFKFHPLAAAFTVPTSFETRNVGSTLEIAPNVGELGQLVDVQLAPEIVRFAGYKVHLERRNHLGELYQDKHPVFDSRDLGVAVTCRDGQYVLLSALPALGGEAEEKRVLMVFLKCDVLVVKESE